MYIVLVSASFFWFEVFRSIQVTNNHHTYIIVISGEALFWCGMPVMGQGPHILHKSRNHLEILGAWRVDSILWTHNSEGASNLIVF